MAESTPIFALETVVQDSHLSNTPSPPLKKHKSTHDIDHCDLDSEAGADTDETASISSSILHRHHDPSHGHRRAHLPPLPDLRFEQSYLASISSANGDPWRIFLITIRDQVVFPLVQGMVFSLGMAGWRAWNSRARFLGRGLGARVRRWWGGI
ncbi:hypothetical protein L211DRAFT_856177 [Terfezia boudieri ATCC MYA-4762]|uniref:DUF1770-domain-containing protein n=1 Tax=Terfezia boudieri ATCC MYA-4762 TaxID=1051890 RepID=A0A3N4MB87_9PEZI|nr:hypothetical protein L211DRAFT_856177 [Terfezia boudieri ATCC MYA-4762]